MAQRKATSLQTPLLVCNWKMNPQSLREARALASKIIRAARYAPPASVLLAPPFPYVAPLHALLKGQQSVALAAQNSTAHEQRALTGEVSYGMLADMGVSRIIVGHSERRYIIGETDKTINEKVALIHAHGMVPLLCVGETKKTTPAKALAFIEQQLVRDVVGFDKRAHFSIAYEPVWAIGGTKEVDPSYAAHVIKGIHAFCAHHFSSVPRVLYGGSVHCKNIDDFLYYKDIIDGFLIGSASLRAQDMTIIIKKIYGKR